MTITNEQADYLIHLKKKIIQDDKILDAINLNQEYPIAWSFDLVSADDEDFSFRWIIKQSGKNALKISLHYQEADSNIGLLRVDYYGAHQNPQVAKDDLPEKFRQYVGKFFTHDESHVHYHVEGYKPLAWAIPIADTDIKTMGISNENKNSDLIASILDFAQIINIETQITINPLLL